MSRRLPWPCIPLDAWNEYERTQFTTAHAPGGFLDEPGSLTRYSVDRLRNLRQAWGNWLGFLEQAGVPVSATESLNDKERLGRYISALQVHLRPATVQSYLQRLTDIAPVLYPDISFALLASMNRRMRRLIPRSARLERAQVPAEDLLKLAEGLMSEVPLSALENRHLHQFRDGLCIAVLVHAPMRVRDLAALKISSHLCRIEDRYRVDIQQNSKTGAPLCFWLDAWLTPWMDLYLEVIRPALLRRSWRGDDPSDKGHLWINDAGEPIHAKHLSDRLGDRSERALGVRITPHCVRSIIATTIAIEDPEHVGMIKPILGHTDLRTSEIHYNMAETSSAARSYHAMLGSIRQGDDL